MGGVRVSGDGVGWWIGGEAETAEADVSMIADEPIAAADASAGSEQAGPDMTEEAFAVSEKTGESETPTEVLTDTSTETPAAAPAEVPAAAD